MAAHGCARGGRIVVVQGVGNGGVVVKDLHPLAMHGQVQRPNSVNMAAFTPDKMVNCVMPAGREKLLMECQIKLPEPRQILLLKAGALQIQHIPKLFDQVLVMGLCQFFNNRLLYTAAQEMNLRRVVQVYQTDTRAGLRAYINQPVIFQAQKCVAQRCGADPVVLHQGIA